MKALQELLNKNGFALKVDGVIGAKTLAAVQQYAETLCAKRKFKLPTKGFLWLRLDDNLTDTFDDIVIRFNSKADMVAPCSTTAGDYYRLNPITYQGITGTAIACEQQVLKSHRWVTSRTWLNLWTKMPYAQQIQPIRIYRDGNKDRKINREISTLGLFGINFHRGWAGNRNWNVSAGCMVVPDGYWQKMIEIFSNGELLDFTLIDLTA